MQKIPKKSTCNFLSSRISYISLHLYNVRVRVYIFIAFPLKLHMGLHCVSIIEDLKAERRKNIVPKEITLCTRVYIFIAFPLKLYITRL